MKFKIWSVVSLVALWSGVALAQDPVKVDPAHYKVLLENASVRVLSINYPVGATSKMHQHPDAIAIMLGNAKVKFATPDGKSAEQEMGNETATSPGWCPQPHQHRHGPDQGNSRRVQGPGAWQGDAAGVARGHEAQRARRRA